MTTATIHQGDAVTWLRSLPSGSVSCIVTDIAYESLEKHRDVGTTTRLKQSAASSNPWFGIFRNERIPELLVECYRVLADDAHFYFYCDAETMFLAKPMGEAAGFTFHRPIVWDKVTIGMGYHYRGRHEYVLFFEKGKRKLNDLGIADVIAARRLTGMVCDRCMLLGDPAAARPPINKGVCSSCGGAAREAYSTEKNPRVTQVLIEQSTSPGELVADAFMGSGSTGVAALACGRAFAGNDIAEDAIALAMSRMPGAVVVPDAPPFVPAGQRDLFGGGR